MIIFWLLVAATIWAFVYTESCPFISDRDKEITRRYNRMKKDPTADSRRAAIDYIRGLSDNQPNRDAIERLKNSRKGDT